MENQQKILIYCGFNHGPTFKSMASQFDVCYGFEANPELFIKLENHYTQNPPNNTDIKLYNNLLSNTHGVEEEFYIQDANDTQMDYASSLGRTTEEYYDVSGNVIKHTKTIKLKTTNLLKFLEENNVTEIDTLLTDLEGSDLNVLKTLKPLIDNKKIKNIQCEVEPNHKPIKYEGLDNKFKGFVELLGDNYRLVDESPQGVLEGWFSIDYNWVLK
tara:strand:+ start:748 stop:1392 length:645 start_codon:yes stop_codon:yes gene_type:complete